MVIVDGLNLFDFSMPIAARSRQDGNIGESPIYTRSSYRERSKRRHAGWAGLSANSTTLNLFRSSGRVAERLVFHGYVARR
jgi:hypothetical protein